MDEDKTLGTKRSLSLRNEIVNLLAEDGCTVRQAEYILAQALRAISANTAVQPVEGGVIASSDLHTIPCHGAGKRGR